MGLILYELCAKFKTGMERRENLEYLRKTNNVTESVSINYPHESELIKLMCNKRPIDRPTANEILNLEVYKDWKSSMNV